MHSDAGFKSRAIYSDDPRRLRAALDHEPSVDLTFFLDGGELVARRAGEEDVALLDAFLDGRVRAEAALHNPNAGEVLVSAAPGWEFADLGGGSHIGAAATGRSRSRTRRCRCSRLGSATHPSITEIKALVLAHFVSVARRHDRRSPSAPV